MLFLRCPVLYFVKQNMLLQQKHIMSDFQCEENIIEIEVNIIASDIKYKNEC